MEKFSVLMSIYKKKKPEYLKQALDSLLNQTLLPDEILIVKDGLLTPELDKTLDEYAVKNKTIKFLEFEKNRGLGLALRDGVVACKNEIIARMDTDDISKPDRFQKQLNYLSQHPDITLLGTWIEEFDKDPNIPKSNSILPITYEEILKFAKRRNPFRHVSVIFKKSAVIDSGNYRHFLWFEDYDLWIRMLKKGYKAANLPEVLLSVREDKKMYERRGGWQYSKQDIKFERFLLKIGYINFFEFLTNIIIRGSVRLLPNNIRKFIYSNILRKNIE